MGTHVPVSWSAAFLTSGPQSERGPPMAALDPGPKRRSRVITLMTTVGVIAVLAGGTLVGANIVGVSGAATTTTLSLVDDGRRGDVQQLEPVRPDL